MERLLWQQLGRDMCLKHAILPAHRMVTAYPLLHLKAKGEGPPTHWKAGRVLGSSHHTNEKVPGLACGWGHNLYLHISN